MAAAVLAAALSVYACLWLPAPALGAGLGAGAVAALLLVAGAAGPWAGAIPVAQALLGLLYLTGLVASGRALDAGAPAYAAGLLLAGELSALAADLRQGRLAAPAATGRRLLVLALVGVAAVGAGWLLLAATALPLPGGPATTLAGVAAALAALALLAAGARRGTG